MSIFIFGGVSSFRDFPDDYIFSPGYCNITALLVNVCISVFIMSIFDRFSEFFRWPINPLGMM